ncbi:MAG: hypothetical protein M3220_21680, partial [Chloroflexota bacterium]|nr:hypothetical protein [Chloroflexota bacterium]
MVEWQVREPEGLPPAKAGKEPRRGEKWPGMLGLLLLVMVGALALRWSVAERERAMRADVTAVVAAEEQARRFGLYEEAASLAAPDTPVWWQERYAQTFVPPPEAPPVTVEVQQLELDGRRVLATVHLDGRRQLRAYRLLDRRWHRDRLSLDDWGVAADRPLPHGMALYYRQRDATFAARLAEALPALLTEVDSWQGEQAIRLIEIAPREFAGAIVDHDTTVLRLNSPWLLLGAGPLDGEATIRLALARAFLKQETPPAALPGAARLLEAARARVALRWALAPEEEEALRTVWREVVREGEWPSPFFSDLRPEEPLDPLAPSRADAAALLMAEYIERVWGDEALAGMAQQVPVAPTWDHVMREATGLFTYQIEAATVAYTRGGLQ